MRNLREAGSVRENQARQTGLDAHVIHGIEDGENTPEQKMGGMDELCLTVSYLGRFFNIWNL